MTHQEWPAVSAESNDRWEQNAAFWDNYMGDDGNSFHRLLVRPMVEALLDVQPGQTVLDVACGNGNFSRRLADLGAQVTAIDASDTMIARAQARTTTYTERITYQVIDATDEGQLLALGAARFDAAVANMALMDMAVIEPLLTVLGQLLKPGGCFVFSITHPCFQPPGLVKVVEEVDRAGEMVTQYALKVSRYITPTETKGLAIIGQPVPQYLFHRPLSLLLKQCFEAGFVLDGLEEPVFDSEAKGSRPFSWDNFKEIPPALIARLRLGH